MLRELHSGLHHELVYQEGSDTPERPCLQRLDLHCRTDRVQAVIGISEAIHNCKSRHHGVNMEFAKCNSSSYDRMEDKEKK